MLQCAKQNGDQRHLPRIKLQEGEQVTDEIVLNSLRRALDQFSSLQASDGHWPGDFSGVMFIMPGLVRLGFCTQQHAQFFFLSLLDWLKLFNTIRCKPTRIIICSFTYRYLHYMSLDHLMPSYHRSIGVRYAATYTTIRHDIILLYSLQCPIPAGVCHMPDI